MKAFIPLPTKQDTSLQELTLISKKTNKMSLENKQTNKKTNCSSEHRGSMTVAEPQWDLDLIRNLLH